MQDALHFRWRPAKVAMQRRGGDFIAFGNAPLVTVNMAEDDLVVEAAALVAAPEHC